MDFPPKDVPKYLVYCEGQKIYSSRAFRGYHLLYRTGFKEKDNPIEFPAITLTAISVCWSKRIKEKDVLATVLLENPKLGNHVYFGRVKAIKRVLIEDTCAEGKFAGQHQVSNVVMHRPIPKNYSHSEILIKHTYPEDNVLKTQIIEHKEWGKSVFGKGKPKEFFKPLGLKYRARMATILNNDIDKHHTPFLLKFIPKHWVIRLLILSRLSFFSTGE